MLGYIEGAVEDFNSQGAEDTCEEETAGRFFLLAAGEPHTGSTWPLKCDRDCRREERVAAGLRVPRELWRETGRVPHRKDLSAEPVRSGIKVSTSRGIRLVSGEQDRYSTLLTLRQLASGEERAMPTPGPSSGHMQTVGALAALFIVSFVLLFLGSRQASDSDHDAALAPAPAAAPETSRSTGREPEEDPVQKAPGQAEEDPAGGDYHPGRRPAAGDSQRAPEPQQPPDAEVGQPSPPDLGKSGAAGGAAGGAAAPPEDPPDNPVPPRPAGPPANEPGPVPSKPDVDQFLDECNNKIAAWKHDAKITWPGSLDIEVEKSAVFIASIDLSGATSELPSGTAKDSALSVQCQATATLKAPDSGELKVDANDGSSNTRSFVPTSKVQWAWSVTAVKPGTHYLQLVIQPALIMGSRSVDATSNPSMQQVVYVSRINAIASPTQVVSFWVKDSWPSILSIGAVLGAATVGVVKWYGNLKDEVARAQRRRDSRNTGADPDDRFADDVDDQRAPGYL